MGTKYGLDPPPTSWVLGHEYVKIEKKAKKRQKTTKLEIKKCRKLAFHCPGLKIKPHVSQSMGNIWSKYGV